MTKVSVFLQQDGSEQLIETELPATLTGAQLYDAVAKAGAETDDATFVFLGEADEPVKRKGKDSLTLAAGALVHVTRCRKVKVTVHFLNRTIEEQFAPGARVRSVKAWAVGKIPLEPQDAAEHVLEICDTKTRPVTDASLQQLTDGKRCSVRFNLVPDTRVEG
ncbi:MAG: hypothetical protein JOZ90_10910 [Alphaproteobacteria bacterium]|nr:hypothetical protein [Alphaproteobacteria bacterium]MBV9371031.1 hypothetical protein [Alphaproteobacteria bacterium]MBV9901595.1 hypothetical protein [Alphaproteobacteria bacterium]